VLWLFLFKVWKVLEVVLLGFGLEGLLDISWTKPA
jgi:hypothetical protein